MLDRPDFIWTDEAVAALKDHWAAGLSCSQIAAEMGQGLTRNSIIGKVTRLKLPKRGKVGTHTTRAQRTDARMQRAPVKPHGNKGQPKVNAILNAAAARRAHIIPPAFEPEPFDAETDVGIDITKRVGLMDLTSHTCRWPVGADTGAAQMFCGRRADLLATGPYCPEHTAKAEYRR